MAKRSIAALKNLISESRLRSENIEEIIGSTRPVSKAARASRVYKAVSGGAGSFQEPVMTAGKAGVTAGVGAGGGEGIQAALKLLMGGNVKGAFKASPGGMGIGAALIVGMLLNKIRGAVGDYKDETTRRMGVEAPMEMSEDDMYYQAMMPELAQERRGVQDALMQAILGSRGQALQVPGERQI